VSKPSTCAETPVPHARSWTAALRTLFGRTSVRFALSAAVSALFLYLAFRGTDFPKLLQALAGANYWWLLLSFSILIVSHTVRAWRWRFFLDPTKRGIGLRNLFSGVMIGYFVNNGLPRAGELARPYTIAKLESISKSAALGTVVVERILDTFAFVLLMLVIPLVYNGPLLESFPWLRDAGVIFFLVMLPVVGLPVILMVRRDWTDLLLAQVARLLPESMSQRLNQAVHYFLDGFLFLLDPAAAAKIFLMTLVVWGLYLVMMYAAFFGFGLNDRLGLRAALVTLAISSIGIAIPTPGGTGTYHAFTSQTLTRLFAVDPTVALSYATATHAVNFIGTSIIGAYFFLKDHSSVREAAKLEEEDVR
jgi:glycosyltransferase 2 family protein